MKRREKSKPGANSPASPKLKRVVEPVRTGLVCGTVPWEYVLPEEWGSPEEYEQMATYLHVDGANNFTVYAAIWERAGLEKKYRKIEGKLLCSHATPHELLEWLKAQAWTAPVLIEAEVLPRAQRSEREPSDYDKHLEMVRNLRDRTEGVLECVDPKAWPVVRDLARTEKELPYTDDPVKVEKHRTALLKLLWGKYPEDAKRICVPKPPSRQQDVKQSVGRNSTEPKKEPSGFTHSDDYRSVTLRGETHLLTAQQAHVIQILHEAYKNGTPEVGTASVLEKVDTTNSRLRDTFKSNPPAWKVLVVRGKRRGTLRLNLYS